jgi:uncharacterized integral membrane protein
VIVAFLCAVIAVSLVIVAVQVAKILEERR